MAIALYEIVYGAEKDGLSQIGWCGDTQRIGEAAAGEAVIAPLLRWSCRMDGVLVVLRQIEERPAHPKGGLQYVCGKAMVLDDEEPDVAAGGGEFIRNGLLTCRCTVQERSDVNGRDGEANWLG